MKYPAGTLVVLKDDIEPSSLIPGATVKIDRVRNGVYISHQGSEVWTFEDSDIDVAGTAELEKDKVLHHYGGMLEELRMGADKDEDLLETKIKTLELEAQLKEALKIVEDLKDSLVDSIGGEEW